jgi:hypothetical protein
MAAMDPSNAIKLFEKPINAQWRARAMVKEL